MRYNYPQPYNSIGQRSVKTAKTVRNDEDSRHHNEASTVLLCILTTTIVYFSQIIAPEGKVNEARSSKAV